MKNLFYRFKQPSKCLLVQLSFLIVILIFAISCDYEPNGGDGNPPMGQSITLFKPIQIMPYDCEGHYYNPTVYYSIKVMTYNSGDMQPKQYGSTVRIESSDGLVDAKVEVPEKGEFFVQVDAETDCIIPYKTFCSPKNCSKQYYKITTPRTENIFALSFMNYDFDGERCCN